MMSKATPNTSMLRLVVITVVFAVGIAAILIVSGYRQQINLSEEQELARLEGIVSTLALEINGDLHQQLIEAFPEKDAITQNDQDSIYLSIHETLRAVQDANMIETAIYTMVYDSTEKKFCFGVTSTTPFWKHAYQDYPEVLLENYHSGGIIPMYSDRNGTWLSAFRPLKNQEGSTVAILQVDQRFDHFMLDARSNALSNAALPIEVSLVIILILFLVLRGMMKVQEQLREERDELDDLRKELLANVSHDLRTPLASIQGYLETVLMKGDQLDKDRIERYLATSLKNTEKLKALVDELFELSKLESRDRKPKLEIFSIAELGTDIGASLKIEALRKEVHLQCDIPRDLPQVCGDLALIDRVLQNLISNAIKFTNAGDIVTLRMTSTPKKVIIQVCDTGIGISKEDLPKVFDRFHTRPSGSNKGTGLGLAIVRTILQAHDAPYSIESEAGKGTTFTFELVSA